MTRALVIESAGNLWGSERALLDFVKATSDLRLAVCCPPNTPIVDELKARGVPVLPYYVRDLHKKSRWHRIHAALGVLRACVMYRPQVIHLNQSGSYKVVLPAATLLRIPIVAHVRIFEDAAYLAEQRPVPHRLRAVIAISRAVQDELRQFPSLARIPLHRIYDAYVPENRSAMSKGPGVALRVACVGRLVPIKGQDILVGALAILRGQGIPVSCVMAGEGPAGFTQTLKATASAHALNGAIDWTGFVRDVGSVLQRCAVLVCPSHREPLGRVIFEAWNASVVPIAFAGSGGAAEVIAGADGGLLYEKQTPESLAAAIRQALALSSDEASRLVRNGRAWMSNHCDANDYGRAIAGVFASVTERRGAK